MSLGSVILTYGSREKKLLEEKYSNFEVVDVTSKKEISNISKEEVNSFTKVYATSAAWVFARKVLPKLPIERFQEEEITTNQEESRTLNQKENIITAAETEDGILISKDFHPLSGSSHIKCWLTIEHLEMIQKLVGDGYEVRLLSPSNQVIRTFKKGNKNGN